MAIKALTNSRGGEIYQKCVQKPDATLDKATSFPVSTAEAHVDNDHHSSVCQPDFW